MKNKKIRTQEEGYLDSEIEEVKAKKNHYFGRYKPSSICYLTSIKGVKLRTCVWKAELESMSKQSSIQREPVVFLHGNTEYCEKYEDFFKDLNEYGFDVYCFDFRSHGLSGGGMKGRESYVTCDDFKDFLYDFECIYGWVKR